ALQRPSILTGIEEVATRSDLLDRSLTIVLPAIPTAQRQTEASFLAAFGEARPAIFGAVLDGVAAALRNESMVELPSLPRMADFAVWVEAAASGLGWAPGDFLCAYEGNRAAASDIALDALPVGPVLREFMAGRAGWRGTATELLKELEGLAGETVKHDAD